MYGLSNECFASCGSTNPTILYVTGYLEDPGAVLLVDEL